MNSSRNHTNVEWSSWYSFMVHRVFKFTRNSVAQYFRKGKTLVENSYSCIRILYSLPHKTVVSDREFREMRRKSTVERCSISGQTGEEIIPCRSQYQMGACRECFFFRNSGTSEARFGKSVEMARSKSDTSDIRKEFIHWMRTDSKRYNNLNSTNTPTNKSLEPELIEGFHTGFQTLGFFRRSLVVHVITFKILKLM